MLTRKEFDAFQENDQQAFKKVFDLYHASLLFYVKGLIKSESDAEEVLQEAYVSLFLNRDKVETETDLYPYLFTIVKRMTISYFRRKVISAKYLENLKMDWSEAEESTYAKLREKELQEAHMDSIEELPIRQKQVYKMNKLEHKSYQEIADDLGISRNTVKNQIIAATKIIRLKLSRFYFLFFL